MHTGIDGFLILMARIRGTKLFTEAPLILDPCGSTRGMPNCLIEQIRTREDLSPSPPHPGCQSFLPMSRNPECKNWYVGDRTCQLCKILRRR